MGTSVGPELTATMMAAATVCAGCATPTGAAPSERGKDAAGALDASDATATVPALYPSQLPDDFHCDPTIESIRDGIFLTSCGWDSCHGLNNSQWGLTLVADAPTVQKELVGVPAAACDAWTRVVPGDPEHSYLWSKISQEKPACGERMPWGVVPLPNAALDCVEQWIRSL